MNPELEFIKIAEEGVLSSAKWLNNVIFIGGGLLITINLYRAFKQKAIEINGLKLPLSKSWIPVSAYTLAHLYCALILVTSVNRYSEQHEKDSKDRIAIKDDYHLLWEKLTLSGEFTFRHMKKRSVINTVSIPLTGMRIKIFDMSLKDITTWIYAGLVLLILNGVPNFQEPNKKRFWASFVGAVFLATINWIIGSIWTASLSELLNH